MITQENEKRIAPQKCPLCGNLQDVIVNGWIKGEKEGELLINKDKGYSFCNCKNVFFTDWSNMKKEVYNQEYIDKYNGEPAIGCIKNYRIYLKKVLEFMVNYEGYRFLEIGSTNDAILDEAKSMGFITTGLDISDRNSRHPFIHYNFEDWKSDNKYDFIFASHIFEHFKEPLEAIKKCNQLLKNKGFLFIAMPDPYFIDWQNPYVWGHWHLEEHHILWDMDSFAKELELRGFEILIKKHNIDYAFICINDFHILARKL